jgi:PAS domain S-box-containing protein
MADKLRVLYVDDEPGLLDIGKLFLERGGTFAVDTLTSAVVALEQLKTERYDAIISDYQMPEMDGISFLKQLKALGNKTPFIIFTGRGREEVVIEALNNGADFYIQKGGEPKSQFAELAHKIKTAVGRKQADDALKDSEQRLTDITNFLPDATFAIDTSGCVIAWNKAIEEMTGVPARDILGKGNYEYSVPFYGERRPILIDLVSIPNEELTRGRYSNIKKEGGLLTAETSLPHPMGRYSILMGKASRLYNRKGIVTGAIESIRDITEQKLASEKLTEASLRYKALIAASNTGAWENHRDSGFLWCSPEYFSMLGRDINDFDLSGARNIEQTWTNLLHPEDRERASRHFENYLSNPQGMYEQNFRMLHKDGHWVWIWSRGKTVLDASGKPTSITVGTHIDVTDRKRSEEELLKKNEELSASYEQITAAEEELRANLGELTRQETELRESEEKFKTLFESAGDAIIIMDRHVFLDCNRKTEEIYRRTHDQIIGHSPLEFSPEHQPDGQLSAHKVIEKINAAHSGENRFFEWTHIHPDGTPFIVEVSLNRFMVKDTYYLQAIVRDITDRKQNETQTALLSTLKEKLLGIRSLKEQLTLVSESCVTIFDADFARIWLIKDADLCEKGCRHATVTVGPEVCRNRSHCLHLMVSSGRYTHIDGGHQRVPFGCYKIGRVASGEEPFFITNDVVHDPQVHDHNWAQSLGLVSFAGFRLLSTDKKPFGVLAFFKKREILPREEKLLVDLANTLSQVIISGLAEEELLKKNEELIASYEQIAATEEELRANLGELTRQEQMLKENEERYRQFFKTTLDSVFITTPDGQWVDCNDSLVETFGYGSRNEIFNLPVTAFYAHPDQRAEFLKLVERDGFVKERPLQFKKKDGTVLFGLITIVPQKNPDGSLKGFIGTVHDITGKKRAYAPHSSREPFNQSRVENLPDYILVYGQDGKILYINPAAVKALGSDADTITGTSVLSYVAEEFRESVAAKMVERNELGEIPIYEIELLTPGGIRKLVFIKGTRVLYDNNPATLLLLIDITKRKALEDELTARAAELVKISTAFQQANKKLMLLSGITRQSATRSRDQ